MAILYITEFSTEGRDGLGNIIPVAMQLPAAEQTVVISGVSAQSAAFQDVTTLVRVHTDSTCSILFGTNPTATTAKMRMTPNQTEYFSVRANSGLKIAVIANT